MPACRPHPTPPPARPFGHARLAATLLGAVLATMAAHPDAAAAPAFKWRDASGRIVYSDLPPPPGARVTLLAAPAGSATGVPSTTLAAPQEPRPASWVEREKASRQKATERAEAEREQAELARQAGERTRVCEEARAGLRTLESGVRLTTIDERGERAVVDDAERARRTEAMQRAVADHCGKAS
ncbi:DUF4124 domain-containing protein [Zeimonas arvi]|nr:DUF4124 domain-containing protein [Zeimonas arvi]